MGSEISCRLWHYESFGGTLGTLGSYLALGRLLSDCDTATEFFAEPSTDNESFFIQKIFMHKKVKGIYFTVFSAPIVEVSLWEGCFEHDIDSQDTCFVPRAPGIGHRIKMLAKIYILFYPDRVSKKYPNRTAFTIYLHTWTLLERCTMYHYTIKCFKMVLLDLWSLRRRTGGNEYGSGCRITIFGIEPDYVKSVESSWNDPGPLFPYLLGRYLFFSATH